MVCPGVKLTRLPFKVSEGMLMVFFSFRCRIFVGMDSGPGNMSKKIYAYDDI
jgi:hypothetical protein